MAETYDFARLGKHETVESRPFTAVQHNAGDVRALRTMARHLADVMLGPEPLPAGPLPVTIESLGPDRKYVRVVVNRPAALQADRDLALVGFFGQKRHGASGVQVDAVDTQLQAEFPAYPEVLAYCSLQLDDGNYGNLVLLDDDSGRQRWREGLHHQYAAVELAPRLYMSVRLHNGTLLGGLRKGDIRLTRTKYFDYQDGLWCGLRDLA